jgi:hypothetical protein
VQTQPEEIPLPLPNSHSLKTLDSNLIKVGCHYVPNVTVTVDTHAEIAEVDALLADRESAYA